jgi:hypothetical protein
MDTCRLARLSVCPRPVPRNPRITEVRGLSLRQVVLSRRSSVLLPAPTPSAPPRLSVYRLKQDMLPPTATARETQESTGAGHDGRCSRSMIVTTTLKMPRLSPRRLLALAPNVAGAPEAVNVGRTAPSPSVLFKKQTVSGRGRRPRCGPGNIRPLLRQFRSISWSVLGAKSH